MLEKELGWHSWQDDAPGVLLNVPGAQSRQLPLPSWNLPTGQEGAVHAEAPADDVNPEGHAAQVDEPEALAKKPGVH